MYTRTITYQTVRATADYTCSCSGCGKTLERKETVEHTINPFNVNEDGTVRNRAEVYARASEEAKRRAAVKEGVPQVCRDCEHAPTHALLIEMLESGEPIPEPDHYYGTPLNALEDRKHVMLRRERCDCGSDCCAGYKRKGSFVLTKKGRELAQRLAIRAPRSALCGV